MIDELKSSWQNRLNTAFPNYALSGNVTGSDDSSAQFTVNGLVVLFVAKSDEKLTSLMTVFSDGKVVDRKQIHDGQKFRFFCNQLVGELIDNWTVNASLLTKLVK